MRLVLFLAVTLLMPASAFNRPQNISGSGFDAERDLLNLVQAWNEAETKGDYEYIASLLADDFSFFRWP